MRERKLYTNNNEIVQIETVLVVPFRTFPNTLLGKKRRMQNETIVEPVVIQNTSEQNA
jgi:hypothetical protein